MFKAMGVAGSARKRGNSATLLKAVMDGAAEAGAGGDVVYLNDLRFAGCQGCQPCTADATCRVKDDLTGVLETARAADVWVLAAPIYFDGVCGQMKLFFDRLHHLISAAGTVRKQLTSPRAGAVIITYEDKARADYVDVARRMANYLGWMGDFGEVPILDGAKLGPPEAAAAREDLLDEARAMGRSIVQQLAQRAGHRD